MSFASVAAVDRLDLKLTLQTQVRQIELWDKWDLLAGTITKPVLAGMVVICKAFQGCVSKRLETVRDRKQQGWCWVFGSSVSWIPRQFCFAVSNDNWHKLDSRREWEEKSGFIYREERNLHSSCDDEKQIYIYTGALKRTVIKSRAVWILHGSAMPGPSLAF